MKQLFFAFIMLVSGFASAQTNAAIELKTVDTIKLLAPGTLSEIHLM